MGDERVRVRTATVADLSTVRGLFSAAFTDVAATLGYRPGPMDVDYGALFRDRFAVIAEIGGGGAGPLVVGAAVARPRPSYLYVEALAVRPGFQRRGVGAAALAALERLAGELCFDRVLLHTSPALEEAMRFYAAQGYQEVARRGGGAMGRVLFAKRAPNALRRLLSV